MYIQTELIQAFLSDSAIEETALFSLLDDFTKPDPMRKEVVKELTNRLTQIVEAFPTFNPAIWNVLFQDTQDITDDIIIVPVAGTKGHCMIKEDHLYILVDLIQIADMTPIVSQMCYVMQNYLHQEIAQLCIRQHYPFTAQSYHEMLDYFTFTNGLANYIAWNESAHLYKFQTEKYDPYKEKAFGMLYSAIEVENKALQHKVLSSATHGDFWNQFPGVAGMFYINDLYQEFGVKGLQSLFQTGWMHLCDRIFQE